MAGQFLDDFQGYGGNAALMLNGKYAEVSAAALVADPDPTVPVGTYALNGANGAVRRVLSSAQTTVGIAYRIWTPSLVGECVIFTVQDVNAATHCFVTFDASGYLKAYRWDNAGFVLLGTSATPVMVANAWQHMEAKFFIDAAAGTIAVRREGVAVLTVGPVRTSSDRAGLIATVQNVCIYKRDAGIPLAVAYYVKDFCIWDGSGARNNNFLGSRVVKRLRPNGDVVFPWTPSTGVTGWNRINVNAPTDDASYIYAPDPAPAASLFTLEDLAITVTSVAFVQAEHRSRKTDGGDGNIQVGLKSAATTSLGADRPITTAYTYYSDIFDNDPNGGGAWSVAAVNALQLQLNRTL
jgi:hypothetical protein